MYSTISQFRQAWIARHATAAAKPRLPFRQSHGPAIVYSAAFALVASLLLSVPLAWPGLLHLPSIVMAITLLVILCIGCFWEALACFPNSTPNKNASLGLLYLTLLLSISIGCLCFLGIQFVCGELPDRPRIVLLACLPIILPSYITPAMLTLLASPAVGIIASTGQALLFALQVALFAANQEDFSTSAILPFVVAAALSGLVSAAVVPHTIQRFRVHSRTRLFQLSPIAAVAPIIAIIGGGLCLAILRPEALVDAFTTGWSWVGIAIALLAFSFLSCLVQAGIVATLHSLFELLFHYTSNISLQAYSDLENHLIDRLASEAPGTHSHCISVATIAAKAADAIGANSILTRIGAYYHDIGKLKKPALFTENQITNDNPLNRLPPKTSASWLRSHVKDGVSLAIVHKLPLPVQQIIAEHHGTSTMAFFLHKAKQEAIAAGLPPESVDESLFRYEGPKPSTRESGVLMIADCVEAACRSLQKATPGAIESKVNEIIQAKILDGQFDECPLSMADIAIVRKSLTNSLVAILHSRIAYPGQEPAIPATHPEPAAPTPTSSNEPTP